MGRLANAAFTLAWIAVAAVHPYMQAPQVSKLLIAHRGASAYAPEHTLTAYRLAIVQDADYVEQDLAVTRDGVLICLHDDSLERTTDVEEIFPQRATIDPVTGRRQWLAVDFTLAEIKQLDAGSWFDPKFAGERVPTWEEAVAVVGTMAGLYPELKTPSLYQSRGIDMTRLFAESMQRLGLTARPAGSIVVQSFDEGPLRELSKQFPTVPRTFLIEVRDGPRWLTREGLAEIATFATGIGPSKILLEGQPGIVRMAHDASLTVTPYTFTTRGAPTRFADVGAEMRHYLNDLNVDALFTDNPDRFPRNAGSR
ncbi:MAG: glycerophosphodiester phosphodiesterase family protein [Vicinamibacterales bacterium]